MAGLITILLPKQPIISAWIQIESFIPYLVFRGGGTVLSDLSAAAFTDRGKPQAGYTNLAGPFACLSWAQLVVDAGSTDFGFFLDAKPVLGIKHRFSAAACPIARFQSGERESLAQGYWLWPTAVGTI